MNAANVFIPPKLADVSEGMWIGCNRCHVPADPRFAELPSSVGESGFATSEQVWRACMLRGWTGTIQESLCPMCSIASDSPAPPEVAELKASRPSIPEEYRRVIDLVELHAVRPSKQTARDLCDAIRDYIRSQGGLPSSQACPCLGMMYSVNRIYRFRFGWLITLLVWFCRHVYMRGRAGWNDFEMAAWMTTHDPFYVERIYQRLQTTRGMVQETCEWMVTSVCQQNPLFNEQWMALGGSQPQSATAGKLVPPSDR